MPHRKPLKRAAAGCCSSPKDGPMGHNRSRISGSSGDDKRRCWRLHPGNIPTLYDSCVAAIRRSDRIMDALLLGSGDGGVLLPDDVARDVLGERSEEEEEEEMDVEEGGKRWEQPSPPTASREPSCDCTCESPCPSGFFPTSAVFLDEGTAVLLDGASGGGCLKRCTVTIGGDEEDGRDCMRRRRRRWRHPSLRWSEVEWVPEAFRGRGWGGGGTTTIDRSSSDAFVLREGDGAAVGVAGGGELCVYRRRRHHCRNVNSPPPAMERTKLRFRDEYDFILLPRPVRRCRVSDGDEGGQVSREDGRDASRFLFALGCRSVRHSAARRGCELLRIDVGTGSVRRVQEEEEEEEEEQCRRPSCAVAESAAAVSAGEGVANRKKEGEERAGEEEGSFTSSSTSLPRDLRPESLLDLLNGDVMLLGTVGTPAAASTSRHEDGDGDGVSSRLRQRRQTLMYRGRLGTDGDGAPVVRWRRERMVLADDGCARHDDTVPSDAPSRCGGVSLCMHASGGGSSHGESSCNRHDPAFFASTDGGETWKREGLMRRGLTNGRDGFPPAALAMSPSGRLYAFGYDAEDCRAAEMKFLMRSKVVWPPLRVFEWR